MLFQHSKLFWLTIVCGFTYQLIDITNEYLEYPIINELSVRSDHMNVPPMTFCFHQKNRYTVEEIKAVIGLQGFVSLITEYDRLYLCIVYNDGGRVCQDQFNVTLQLTYANLSVCVTIPIQQLPNLPKVSQIIVSSYFYNKARFLYHSSGMPIHFDHDHNQLTLLYDQSLVMDFDKSIQTLLPFPYATDCVDYTAKDGPNSQNECQFELLRAKELEVCDQDYHWNRQPMHGGSFKGRLNYLEYPSSGNSCRFHIDHYWLNKMCKVDCTITRYALANHNYYQLNGYLA